MMKFFSKFTAQKPSDPDVTVYRVEDMHCSHCEATVVRAVEEVPGVEKAKASASANTLTIKGPATGESIRQAVEGIGYTFKGKARYNFLYVFRLLCSGSRCKVTANLWDLKKKSPILRFLNP